MIISVFTYMTGCLVPDCIATKETRGHGAGHGFDRGDGYGDGYCGDCHGGGRSKYHARRYERC